MINLTVLSLRIANSLSPLYFNSAQFTQKTKLKLGFSSFSRFSAKTLFSGYSKAKIRNTNFEKTAVRVLMGNDPDFIYKEYAAKKMIMCTYFKYCKFSAAEISLLTCKCESCTYVNVNVDFGTDENEMIRCNGNDCIYYATTIFISNTAFVFNDAKDSGGSVSYKIEYSNTSIGSIMGLSCYGNIFSTIYNTAKLPYKYLMLKEGTVKCLTFINCGNDNLSMFGHIDSIMFYKCTYNILKIDVTDIYTDWSLDEITKDGFIFKNYHQMTELVAIDGFRVKPRFLPKKRIDYDLKFGDFERYETYIKY